MEELKKNKKKRLFLSVEKGVVLRKKIDEFAKIHNIPEYMADLFIEEVMNSEDDANAHLIEKAVLLGLM